MSIEEAISRVRNELGLYKAWDKPSGFAKDIEILLAEISRLTWDSLKWAETVGQHQAHIKQLVGEIKALTKERGEFIHTIAQLGKENQELRDWKEQQLQVESTWNPQEVAQALGIGLGEDIRRNILPKIKELRERLKRTIEIAKIFYAIDDPAEKLWEELEKIKRASENALR